ncbi:hypothetical protein D3C80_1883390 [compost metagenome]
MYCAVELVGLCRIIENAAQGCFDFFGSFLFADAGALNKASHKFVAACIEVFTQIIKHLCPVMGGGAAPA